MTKHNNALEKQEKERSICGSANSRFTRAFGHPAGDRARRVDASWLGGSGGRGPHRGGEPHKVEEGELALAFAARPFVERRILHRGDAFLDGRCVRRACGLGSGACELIAKRYGIHLCREPMQRTAGVGEGGGLWRWPGLGPG
jgi:hypothetical protein